jgi:hypothetical protein
MAALAACAAVPASIGGQTVSEPALKAAFLLNFAKFTEWPREIAPPSTPIVFCATEVEVASALDAATAGRTIEQRPLVVRRVTLDQPCETCAVLYAGRIDRRQAAQLSATLRAASVLTVGDAPDFAASGGVIELFVDGGRLRFAVNRQAAEGARLKLSAQLLSLAKIVRN